MSELSSLQARVNVAREREQKAQAALVAFQQEVLNAATERVIAEQEQRARTDAMASYVTFELPVTCYVTVTFDVATETDPLGDRVSQVTILGPMDPSVAVVDEWHPRLSFSDGEIAITDEQRARRVLDRTTWGPLLGLDGEFRWES